MQTEQVELYFISLFDTYLTAPYAAAMFQDNWGAGAYMYQAGFSNVKYCQMHNYAKVQ